MTLTDLLNIMFRASQAEVGLLLRVSDPSRARDAFARAKEAFPDAELPPVKFRSLRGHPEGNLIVGPSAANWAASPPQEENSPW